MAPRYAINHDRAERVVRTLIDAWRKKLPPFDRAEPVPAKLPRSLEPGSVQHAVWLMVGLLYMRGQIDSAQAFIRLCDVYDNHPHLFDPNTFTASGFKLMETRAEMHRVLRSNGLGFGIREAVRFWHFNLRKLARFWGGNPLRIFESTEGYEELCKVFMIGKSDTEIPTGFMGLREKMVSMYIYFLTNAKLIKPFMHPGPVDTHNIRIMASTEAVVVIEGMVAGVKYEFYQVSPLIREIYLTYCKTVEDVLDLANALWYLSRDFCSLSQGNGSTIGGYRGRATEVSAKKISWTQSRIDRYNSSCGLCSVESVCKWSLPSAEQYNHGYLEIRSERPKPHIGQGLLIDVPVLITPRRAKPKILGRSGENEVPHKEQTSLF